MTAAIQELSPDEITKGLSGAWKGQPGIEYLERVEPYRTFNWNGSRLVNDGTPIILTAAQIDTPTAAILADTSATYIGPNGERYFSTGTSLLPLGGDSFLTPQMYGAVADDTTDSFAGFQNAVLAAQISGKVLYVPDGKYVTSAAIVITKAIRMFGSIPANSSSSGGSRIRCSAAGPTQVIYVNPTANEIWGGSITDLGLDGNGTNDGLVCLVASPYTISQCRFANLVIKNTRDGQWRVLVGFTQVRRKQERN